MISHILSRPPPVSLIDQEIHPVLYKKIISNTSGLKTM